MMWDWVQEICLSLLVTGYYFLVRTLKGGWQQPLPASGMKCEATSGPIEVVTFSKRYKSFSKILTGLKTSTSATLCTVKNIPGGEILHWGNLRTFDCNVRESQIGASGWRRRRKTWEVMQVDAGCSSRRLITEGLTQFPGRRQIFSDWWKNAQVGRLCLRVVGCHCVNVSSTLTKK